MRHVVQIGLHRTAEYAYLTKPEWYLTDQPIEKLLPPSYYNATSDWQYLGVDKEQESVVHCIQEFPHPNRKWIQHFVDTPDALKLLLTAMEIEKVDVLAMDIEGHEKNVFVDDWHLQLPPIDFIAVEFHPQEWVVERSEASFTESFQRAGYMLYKRGETNVKSPVGATVELQWMRANAV